MIFLYVIGGVWLLGVFLWVYAMIKTHTKPFELRDDELIKRAFFEDGRDDETKGNDNNPGL